MSDDALARIRAAADRIGALNDDDAGFADIEALYVAQTEGGWLHVRFSGLCHEEAVGMACEAVADPAVAAVLRTLEFDGPDDGVKGTRAWNFADTPLTNGDTNFPALTHFAIGRTQPGHHNRSVVGSGDEHTEGGQLAQLLQRMPAIQTFITPSAPDAAFLQQGERPLENLVVDCGYDDQGFLESFGASACFPQLRLLEYGDFNERYSTDWASRCASVDRYEALLRSPAMARVGKLLLRNAQLTPDEIERLKALREDILIVLAQSWDTYA